LKFFSKTRGFIVNSSEFSGWFFVNFFKRIIRYFFEFFSFRILLLKDLLLQLEIQCQESLNKNDDLYSEKITEILNYKNSIKLLINKLEVE